MWWRKIIARVLRCRIVEADYGGDKKFLLGREYHCPYLFSPLNWDLQRDGFFHFSRKIKKYNKYDKWEEVGTWKIVY